MIVDDGKIRAAFLMTEMFCPSVLLLKSIIKLRTSETILDMFVLQPYNLGIGKGLSVLELKNAFEEVNNVKIPHVILPRREGDVDALYCDASDSETELGWKPRFDAKDMCKFFLPSNHMITFMVNNRFLNYVFFNIYQNYTEGLTG